MIKLEREHGLVVWLEVREGGAKNPGRFCFVDVSVSSPHGGADERVAYACERLSNCVLVGSPSGGMLAVGTACFPFRPGELAQVVGETGLVIHSVQASGHGRAL